MNRPTLLLLAHLSLQSGRKSHFGVLCSPSATAVVESPQADQEIPVWVAAEVRAPLEGLAERSSKRKTRMRLKRWMPLVLLLWRLRKQSFGRVTKRLNWTVGSGDGAIESTITGSKVSSMIYSRELSSMSVSFQNEEGCAVMVSPTEHKFVSIIDDKDIWMCVASFMQMIVRQL